MSVKIVSGGQAKVTLAWEILAEAWNDLVRSGNAPYMQGVSPVSPQHEILYAIDEKSNDIVGVLAWVKQSGNLQVDLLYVEPASRRQGVGRALLADLVLRSMKGARLFFAVHGVNNAMDAFMERHKALAACTVFELEV